MEKKPSKTRLRNRRIILVEQDDGCPMHGPWELTCRKFVHDECGDVRTGVHTVTTPIPEMKGHVVETDIQLSDQAMRAIVGMYMRRQAIKTVDALWKWLEENR